MSEFKCEAVRLKIVPHPNADAIEIAMVGDYQSIVKLGQFKDGDLAVYIPEQSILSQWLMQEMGFWDAVGQRGMLHGGARNRVKAIKLRGVVSQGLILGGRQTEFPDGNHGIGIKDRLGGELYLSIGDDYAEHLGIIKFEPELPSHMMGRALGVDLDVTHNYDFDNLKKTPDLFEEGEIVGITEKIHGTLLQVSVVPASKTDERFYQGRVVMTSKGLGGKGIILDHNDEANLYAQTVTKHGLMDKMLAHFGDFADIQNKPVIIFGEVFGRTLSGAGVQDLTYTNEALDYRAFDIAVGSRASAVFMDTDDFNHACRVMDIPQVPMLYMGPYSKEIVLEHTDGKTTLGSDSSKAHNHIREGVVVKSFYEEVGGFRRKVAKSVSNDYLLRKGDVSEFS